jgi:Zn-dependent protease
VLYSLSHPAAFPLLLIGLFLAWGVHVEAQRLLQSRIPETKWLLQRRPGVAGFIDPFSAVGAILGPASAGWTPPVEWSHHRGPKRPVVLLLLSGPVGNLLVGAACLIGYDQWVGQSLARATFDTYGNYLGDFVDFAQLVVQAKDLTYAQQALLLFGLVQLIVAVISLIPLPPLEGGRLLFLLAPKTIGWQKAEYQLAERNIGLIIVLLGLIRITSSIIPPFAYLADVIAHALTLLFNQL